MTQAAHTTPGATADDLAFFAKQRNPLAASIRARYVLERAVIRRAVTDIIAAGYTVDVDYGEGDIALKKSVDVAKIMEEVCACDEEWLHVRDTSGKRIGTIFLVYGNDGWDVICDYHTSLDAVLVGANELAEQLS